MTNATLEKIYNIAKDIRIRISLEMGTDDLEGMCYFASKELRRALRFEGFRPKIIAGEFRVDHTGPWNAGDTLTHYWLELNNFIIDITADQFNLYLKNDAMSEIIIATYEELPRYLKEKQNAEV